MSKDAQNGQQADRSMERARLEGGGRGVKTFLAIFALGLLHKHEQY